LQSWLLGEQPTHRPRASTEKAVRKTIAKVKPGVGFRDRCRDLDKYLRFNKVGTLEGHMGVDRGKGELLRMVVKSKQPVCVAQTGLCSGHSASCILDACKQATLISFEIKQNDLSKCACSYISEQFPGRHSVVYGNSQETLPKFIADRLPLERYFDLTFIDGGHSYKCAKSDLVHFRKCSRPRGVVVMDDVSETDVRAWTVGPTKAWKEAVKAGIVEQTGQARSMVWGHFIV